MSCHTLEAPEKGPFLGIFGQKTPKKGLKHFIDQKMFKIFPGRSRETSKNAIPPQDDWKHFWTPHTGPE